MSIVKLKYIKVTLLNKNDHETVQIYLNKAEANSSTLLVVSISL